MFSNNYEISENYSNIAERLWEKLEFHKDKFNLLNIDTSKPGWIDDFMTQNPLIWKLAKEVETEYNGYGLSFFQGLWAIVQAFGKTGGLPMMNKYNQVNHKNLKPKE